MIVEVNPNGFCPSEYDLDLNLTSSGNEVSGTATTRLRKTRCADVLGQVSDYTVFNGKVDSGTISFDLGRPAVHRFSGTFAGTRMTGAFDIIQFPESGRFALNRQ